MECQEIDFDDYEPTAADLEELELEKGLAIEERRERDADFLTYDDGIF